MAKPAEATLGNTALYLRAFCLGSNFCVSLEFKPSGVSDGPLGLHFGDPSTLNKLSQRRSGVSIVGLRAVGGGGFQNSLLLVASDW